MNVTNGNLGEVWRDVLKEHRGLYYVTYQPADSRRKFASLDLVFYDGTPTPKEIHGLMEEEMKLWLTRFKVPVMISSFDCKESLIHLPKGEGGSNLMAFVDPQNGEIMTRWGLFQNEELPQKQRTEEYFREVYHNLSFRYADDVREQAMLKQRKLHVGLRIFRIVFVFVVALPVLIELVSLGVVWLGWLLQVISILGGLYKVAKAFGWIKESKSACEEIERQRKMEHYFYHCERNQRGFERLKAENFDSESAERTRREAANLPKTEGKYQSVSNPRAGLSAEE